MGRNQYWRLIEKIGYWDLPLSNFQKGKTEEHWAKLTNSKGDTDLGEINVLICINSTGKTPAMRPSVEEGQGMLFIEGYDFIPIDLAVCEARNLQCKKTLTKKSPDPFVSIQFEQEKYSTNAAERSNSPKWEHQDFFL